MLTVGLAAAYLTAVVWLVWWVVVAVVVPGWTPVAIVSGSMSPAVRSGDIVIAADVPPSQLGPGAVIVFHDGTGGLVTHRVVERRPDGRLTTRGDANTVADGSPVAPTDVLGRGRLLVPAVGRPLVWFQDQRWGPLLAWGGATAGAALVLVRRDDGDGGDAPLGTTRVPTDRERNLIAFAWGGPTA